MNYYFLGANLAFLALNVVAYFTLRRMAKQLLLVEANLRRAAQILLGEIVMPVITPVSTSKERNEMLS